MTGIRRPGRTCAEGRPRVRPTGAVHPSACSRIMFECIGSVAEASPMERFDDSGQWFDPAPSESVKHVVTQQFRVRGCRNP